MEEEPGETLIVSSHDVFGLISLFFRLRSNHSFELVTIGTTAGQKEISMDASSDQRCYTVDTENAI